MAVGHAPSARGRVVHPVPPILQCVELLKVIEFAFRRKNASIAECQSILLRHMAGEIMALFRPLHNKLQGRLTDQKREILMAVRSCVGPQWCGDCALTL